MTTLKLIDDILQLMPVRWGLLVMSVAMLAFTIWCRVELAAITVQRNLTRSEAANLSSVIATQNVFIEKQGKDFAELQKRLQASTQAVSLLRNKLEKRKVEIREIVLSGPCDQQVQQIIDEVRK